MPDLTKQFRIRVADGLVSPVTPGITNIHKHDMDNVIVSAAVMAAISKGRIDYKDAVRCVAAGKSADVLLTDPDVLKPSEAMASAPSADQVPGVQTPPPAPVKSELVAAREEGRAPDLVKLSEEELAEYGLILGVDPSKYSTRPTLLRAVRKAIETAGGEKGQE